MAVTHIGSSGGTWTLEAPTRSVTVTTPAGIVAGDLLLYYSGSTRGGGGGGGGSLDNPVTSAPGGWSYFTETNNTSESWGIEVYVYVGTGSDAGSFVFGYGGSSAHVHGAISAYRGLATGSMGSILNEREAGSCYTSNALTFTNAASLLSTTANATTDLYLSVVMALGYHGSETTPSGLTKRLAHHAGPISGSDTWTGSGILIYDKVGNGAGYTPTYVVDDGSSLGTSVGATIALGLVAIPPSVGSVHGTSTALASATGINASVGAAAGTTSSVVAFSGVHGVGAGTSTALAVGTALTGNAGTSAGASTAGAFTGLRQAVGLAAGTSGTQPAPEDVISNSRRITVDHVEAALDRLCEQFRESQVF